MVVGPLYLLARAVYSKITSARARRRDRIDLLLLSDLPEELQRVRTMLELFEKKLVQIYGTPKQVPRNLEQLSNIVRFLCEWFWLKAVSSLASCTAENS